MNGKTRKMAIACALVASLALAGTAVANSGIGKSDLQGVTHAVKANGALKNRAVGHETLKNHIVSCEKLSWDLTHALCKGELAKTATPLAAAPGANGKDGVPGANGRDGAPGLDGKNGVSGYEVRTYDYIRTGARPGHPGTDPGYVGAGDSSIATVTCSPGKVAMGGGYFIRNGQSEVVNGAHAAGQGATASFPGRMNWDLNEPKPNDFGGWIVYFNGNGPVQDVTLYVTCINAA